MVVQRKEYCFVRVEDIFVVWLEKANRFIQLKEPAFFVFEQWSDSTPPDRISAECVSRYGLPQPEAQRFVTEIFAECDNLLSNFLPTTPRPSSAFNYSQSVTNIPSSPIHPFSVRKCIIAQKSIRFTYGDEELDELFSPLFRSFESEQLKIHGNGNKNPEQTACQTLISGENQTEYSIEIFRRKDRFCYTINNRNEHSFPEEQYEQFHGAIYMELLKIIHNKVRNEWMGVFHTSAVSDETTGLLFMAPAGSGKSTLAALMVAHGYKLISDDFTPIALTTPEIYPFPTAISVKEGAVPLVREWFPQLKDQMEVPENEGTEKSNFESEIRNKTEPETDKAEYPVYFLSLSAENLATTPVKTKAVLFVEYDASVDYSLRKESHLAVMNDFLKQSWFPGTTRSARRFLKWYFQTPIYSLTYSDSEKAISGMTRLLSGDNPAG